MPTPPDATQPPPQAARKPKDVSVHGDPRLDDYFSLRERDNPGVLAHLRAENAYAEAWFKPLDGFRQGLYAEMLARVKQDDEAVPSRKGAYWYLPFARLLDLGVGQPPTSVNLGSPLAR